MPSRLSSNPAKDEHVFRNELPQHEVRLKAFYIARYPVTVAQFRAFVEESGYKRHHPVGLEEVDNHPVMAVSWYDALAYCAWLTGKLRDNPLTPVELGTILRAGGQVSLPSEAEWEKTARGAPAAFMVSTAGGMPPDREDANWIYPWGNQFDANRANTWESGMDGTSTVGCFSGGASPYGIQDMSGNVWEWTRSLYKAYPYRKNDGREDLRGGDLTSRVLRGGSFILVARHSRCALRYRKNPEIKHDYLGFRLVILTSSTLNSENSGAL
jgi:formylglycine-generating enzyme required for sulfatase activity